MFVLLYFFLVLAELVFEVRNERIFFFLFLFNPFCMLVCLVIVSHDYLLGVFLLSFKYGF
jgi:hypothetical protein